MFIISNLLMAVAPVIHTVLNIYVWVIIFRVLITWVNPDPFNPIVQFLGRISDPYLNLFRRFLPPLGGIDFSPIIAVMLLSVVNSFFYTTLMDIAYRLR